MTLNFTVFAKQIFHTIRRFHRLSVLTFLGLAALMYSCNTDVGGDPQNNGSGSEAFSAKGIFANQTIAPPFDNVNISPRELVVNDHNNATTFDLLSGTTISVPANAFVDSKGNPVATAVKIKYREFKSADEIIACGIPMRVIDKEGQDEWMQTAGMFEIRGYTDDGEVQIAPDKSVAVNFASDQEGSYDFWYFDEENGNWTNEGTVEGIPQEAPADEYTQQYIDNLKKRTVNKPVAPPNNKTNRLEFTDLDVSQIPELKGQKSVILLYAGNDPKQAPDNNAWISEPNRWLKKELKPLDQPDLYQLTLYGDVKYSIPVRLPLQEAELKAAQARFEQEMIAYKKDLAALKDKENIVDRQKQFVRSVQLNRFGIYNHDILWRRGDIVPLMANFNFGDLNEALYDKVVVYLITGDERVIIPFTKNNKHTFRFSPSADNKMIAFLPDNQVAFFKQSDFNREMDQIKSAAKSDYVFEMTPQPQDIDAPNDISTLLAMADE